MCCAMPTEALYERHAHESDRSFLEEDSRQPVYQLLLSRDSSMYEMVGGKAEISLSQIWVSLHFVSIITVRNVELKVVFY